MNTEKIPVAILGATGVVGQKFIELLATHPWFEIVALCASKQSANKPLDQACYLHNPFAIPEHLKKMNVQECLPNLPCKLVFSALDSSVAYGIEKSFQEAGYIVISNAKNHRMEPNVPLLIPEINPDHLQLMSNQVPSGKIITNPNCSTIGLAIALKPLHDLFEVKAVNVTTLQAISGAGYPGVASHDMIDNVIPFIKDEEEKIETEPLKIFGLYSNKEIQPAQITISAQCNRVAVQDGHLACVSLKLGKKASLDEIKAAWSSFSGLPQKLKLPSAPLHPTFYLEEEKAPQPKFHRHLDKGMQVSIGRLRTCPIMDYRFVLLSHNTIRGAAGSTILIGELMKAQGLLKTP